MIRRDTEYFEDSYYFFLKEKENKISLYYSYSNTLSEARKKDKQLDFDKKNKNLVKKKIKSILDKKNHKNTDELDKDLKKFKNKIETNEFVDSDGTWLTSRIPIIDPEVSSLNTTDVGVTQRHITNDPVTRGYRVYYGESEIKETDFSDAFGYEETRDMNGKETFKYFQEKLGVDPIEAAERTRKFGKDPFGKRAKKTPKRLKGKGFIDRMTLSETQRYEMIRLIESIIKNNK